MHIERDFRGIEHRDQLCWQRRDITIQFWAFTLTELLVVISVIALLAAMLVPAITRANASAKQANCLNNFRQMYLGWHLYANDHEERLAPNGGGPSAGLDPVHGSWVGGFLSLAQDNPDNTNTSLIIGPVHGGIGAYTRTPLIYKCPADKSLAAFSDGRRLPRVRSYSMNAYMGDSSWSITEAGPFVTFRKLDQITKPSQLWVFIDEHEDSINDCMFWINMIGKGKDITWEELPAARHNGAGAVVFADGHTGVQKWIDPRTREPIVGRSGRLKSSPNNPDVQSLQEKTTFPK